MLLTYFGLKHIKEAVVVDYYKFILLFYSFVIFFQHTPSLGGRYLQIWSLLSIFFLMFIISKKILKNYIFKTAAYTIFLFFAYVGIRLEMVQTSFGVFFGNVFLLPLILSNNMSAKEFIFYIFNF